MYENILIPFDDSEGAAAVLHHASEIAHWADATIHVFYVADTTRDSVTVVDGQAVDGLVQQGEEIVDEAAKTLESLGISYETDIVQGNPAPAIVDYAERYEHDLIVMPIHGREGLSRYLSGSVSEKVVRLSPIPVLTVRMQPDEQLVFPYENILVSTDGSAAATYAAEHLVEFAAALDATVHVLSVVDDAALGLDVRSASSGRGGTGRDRSCRDRRLEGGNTRSHEYRPPRRTRNARRSDPRQYRVERHTRRWNGDDGKTRHGTDLAR